MPYIITTTKDWKNPRWHGDVSRRAVATLDAADVEVNAEIDRRHARAPRSENDRWQPWIGHGWSLSHMGGGAVGPLPDGTVIEVTSVAWSGTDGMYALAGWDGVGPFDGDAIAAYNAAQKES